MQIIAPRHTFDVIVVGSGASGGWAAKRLAEAGVKVALVDAGRPLTDAAYSEHMRPFELKYRDKAHELIRRTRPGMRTRPFHRTANARDRSSNQDDTTVTIPARSSPVAAPRGNMTNRLPSAVMS